MASFEAIWRCGNGPNYDSAHCLPANANPAMQKAEFVWMTCLVYFQALCWAACPAFFPILLNHCRANMCVYCIPAMHPTSEMCEPFSADSLWSEMLLHDTNPPDPRVRINLVVEALSKLRLWGDRKHQAQAPGKSSAWPKSLERSPCCTFPELEYSSMWR